MSEHEINRVVLSGRLVSDPDLRELAGGTPACVPRLASVLNHRPTHRHQRFPATTFERPHKAKQ